ncbi:DUF2971 domain-containing protein [Betaproteobacteria bacterium SCN2]|jgi:hypothetical protein|nr:DUF2971 domain-containing protein [Betaproteobacteria bacterium SCN2]
MQEQQKFQLSLSSIFFPTHEKKLKKFKDANRQLAYYTSSDTAVKVIESQTLWLRNTGVMNDRSEVIHGAKLLFGALKREPRNEFLKALEECFPGISTEFMEMAQNWLPLILGDTFIASFSEHPATQKENDYGRLSMWRAYGAPNGVALILNPDAIFQDYGNTGAYISSVEYMDDTEVDQAFLEIANNIRKNKKLLQSFDRDEIREFSFRALRYAAVCLKHPAFHEELEWRLVASTSLYTGNLVTQSIESIGGVPQLVLKLSLQAANSDLNLKNLVKEVLLGPCAYPEVIERALWEAMTKAGFENPQAMTRRTNIPLRPNQR